MDLREWLFRQEIQTSFFAKILGFNAEYIRKIKRGTIMPGKLLAQEIERVTEGAVTVKELKENFLKKKKENT